MPTIQDLQELLLESRRLRKGAFAERILALQRKANFELMSIGYDILHKPQRIKAKNSNQILSTNLIWEDALRAACSEGDASIDIVLDSSYEFFITVGPSAPDKVNILTGKYHIYDASKNRYIEFSDAPTLVDEIKAKLEPGFLISCSESQFNKIATLHIEVPESAVGAKAGAATTAPLLDLFG